MNRRILKFEEISERTRIPLATLRWMRHRGEGPPTFRLGRRVVGYEDECDAWVAGHHRQSVVGGGDAA